MKHQKTKNDEKDYFYLLPEDTGNEFMGITQPGQLAPWWTDNIISAYLLGVSTMGTALYKGTEVFS